MSRHIYDCPVRWSDLDANGHLNSSRYGVLLEETRMRMFSMLVPKDPAERLARNFLLREQTIRYQHPLETWETPVRIEAWVTDVKRVSLTFHFEVKDDKHVYATATAVVAGYDSIRGGIRRFEQDELEVFNSYADNPPAVGS
ncbi:thioesterase family protein [Streptomyces sp. NPDC006326]|uniref:acyl-CoA thioesterase n=1 Tax=Streptomyces sp. NPDC006326 TaxID=3156752 RepID=UPI0033A1FC9D